MCRPRLIIYPAARIRSRLVFVPVVRVAVVVVRRKPIDEIERSTRRVVLAASSDEAASFLPLVRRKKKKERERGGEKRDAPVVSRVKTDTNRG